MTLASMSLLSRDDVGRVHDASLRLLSDVGIMVESASVRDIFREAGAAVDDSKQLVRLDERLVNSSLKSAPRKIRICSRGGKDYTIPEDGVQLISTDGQPPAVFDAATGEKRKSTLTDLKEMMIIADALPEVDFVWPTVVATDMPTDRSSFYEFLIAMAYTSKHVQHGAASSEEARFQIEVCSAILGSEEELRARPIFSDVCTPISPLRYDAGEAEALVTLSRAGVPVINLSMAIAGAVTPASVAGSLAVINAENLCGLTMTQLASPGAPSVYSSFSGVMDLKSGVFLCGTPEGILMDSAATVMGKHYGLPTCAGGPSNAARSLSSEAGLETALTAASAMLVGADMMVGLGGIDRAGMISKEKLVMDCELWRWLRHLRRGIDISDDTLGLEAIARQGPGGTFLSDVHTAKCLRKEFMIPQVTAYHVSREPDRKQDEMVAFAIKRVKEILQSHKVPMLDDDTKRKVDEVAARHGIVMPDGSSVLRA
jgi:trimethylamine--corrinoid protein Co-methyltransferase